MCLGAESQGATHFISLEVSRACHVTEPTRTCGVNTKQQHEHDMLYMHMHMYMLHVVNMCMCMLYVDMYCCACMLYMCGADVNRALCSSPEW